MNVISLPTGPSDAQALRRRFEALPEFEPPADGFARLLARRAAARRRAGLAAVLAAAAALAGVALVAGLRDGVPQRAATPLALRTQALEADARSARPVAVSSAPVTALEGELVRLDAALQAAYDRGAPAHELEPLWRARTDTLSALVAAYRHADSIVRI